MGTCLWVGGRLSDNRREIQTNTIQKQWREIQKSGTQSLENRGLDSLSGTQASGEHVFSMLI